MINLALSTSIRNLAYPSITLHRSYHIGKAGSVHTAIERGLRKSKGSGFRGLERGGLSHDGSREKYILQQSIAKHEHSPRSNPIKRGSEKYSSTWEKRGRSTRQYEKGSKDDRRGKARIPDENGSKWKRNSASKPLELRNRRGTRITAGEEHSGDYNQRTPRSARTYTERSSKVSEGREKVFDEGSRPFKDWNKGGFGRKRDFGGRSSERSLRDLGRPSTRSFGRSADENSYGSRFHDRSSESSRRYPSLSFQKKSSEPTFGNSTSNDRQTLDTSMTRHESTSSYHGIKNGDNAVEFPTKRTEFSSSSGPRFIQTTDNRIPISIPFTTPASEFLYGTSVVEAALSSRREPRRKLYKLYVYTGENREDTEQDARLEKLARKARVDVVRVGNDWLRVMDKMSAGRPHNGYILEASPLPRLPVKSLGQLTTSHDQDGFEVSIDYQSREEAAVNGASKFIKTVRSQHGRKPLVLLLDSIVDPGNLGGIIRTASFLGVTAIAISTRNSASFTPVVLKASAGASEDVTLFTVNKPAGFVVDSKAAGWKVFAAVAPAKKDDPAMPASLSTEDLDDPLCKDPCILMLGSEGEGLRWNLRSKADVDLYIKGSRESHKVDSLNVSVAAGILCNAFLARSKPVKVTPIRQEQDKEAPKTPKLF